MTEASEQYKKLIPKRNKTSSKFWHGWLFEPLHCFILGFTWNLVVILILTSVFVYIAYIGSNGISENWDFISGYVLKYQRNKIKLIITKIDQYNYFIPQTRFLEGVLLWGAINTMGGAIGMTSG